ncbi:MAG: bifunctional riboflavin kinase/FAD synthetase [Candidatus Hydrogenedentes bacterium]|nr:bifunctional riboflavin kinase/FAD synthetase [Candidatus Hydrogenedentota bacterium]
MIFIENVLGLSYKDSRVVLTIGSFDGVHLGHQEIIRTVVELAKQKNCKSCVIILRPHPRQYFFPGIPLNTLTSEKAQINLMTSLGVEIVGILPFDGNVASIEPENFVLHVLMRFAEIDTIVVGHDFRFGKGAKGDFKLLSKLAEKCSFDVVQVPPLVIQGERVSSSLIRELVLEGEMEEIPIFLGREYSIIGKVVKGKGIGKVLGFPTANIIPLNTAIPPHGVYVAKSILEDGSKYPSAVNIGIAPTIRKSDFAIESHLINFEGDLLNKEVEVIFYKRIRPEKKFSNKDELIKAIEQDVEIVKSYFPNDFF